MTRVCRPGRSRAAAFGRAPLVLLIMLPVTGIAALTTLPTGIAAAGTGIGRAQAPQLTDQQKAEFVRSYESLPKVNVPLDADGAKVLVVKFNDYQCPPCRQSFYDYKPIFAKYAASKQVKFVVKHFPL